MLEARSLQAGLLTVAPAVAVIGGIGPSGLLAAALLIASALLVSTPRDRLGRVLASAGLLAAAGGWVLGHLGAPAESLVVILWAGTLGMRIWPGHTPRLRPRPPAATAALMVVLTLGTAWLVGLGLDTGELGLLTISALLPMTFSAVGRVPVLALLLSALVLLARFRAVSPDPGVVTLAVGPLLLLAESGAGRLGQLRAALTLILSSPARLLVISFGALSLLGTVLLALPFADTTGRGHDLLDAAFTAVSASCVTGLAVLDTPNDLTLFGQLVVAGLIQVGGLGIMTFAAAALLGAGRRLTVREEAAAASALGREARADVRGALVRVFALTLCTEAVGAALLAPLFWHHGDGLLRGAWRAIFTSISAFCNAGFALQSDSLVPYQESPAILLVIAAIITVGALGPATTLTLYRRARTPRGPWRPLSVEVQLILWMTVLLVVGPTVVILVLENANTLAGMPLGERLVNALFQAVTLRTAGFNSVDLAAITPATLALMVVVMFIGGSPGSTAGGVKTTTMAALLLSVTAVMRGQTRAIFGSRHIPHRVVYQATAITTVAVFSVTGALLALLVTQKMPLDVALFEAVSALATVGLSVGGTGMLDGVGKIIILLCMFAGRVGPLTLFIFLIEQSQTPPVDYPSEDIAVG